MWHDILHAAKIGVYFTVGAVVAYWLGWKATAGAAVVAAGVLIDRRLPW